MFPLIGALIGAASGAAQRQADIKRQERTANAAADAQAVSWAKRGQQFIPDVQYAKGSMLGNVLGGGLGGMAQGNALEKAGAFDWLQGAPEAPKFDGVGATDAELPGSTSAKSLYPQMFR